MANDNEPVSATAMSPTPEKRSRYMQFVDGIVHVAKVAWTVPAARSALVTVLIRFGLPSSLVAIGVAVGEALAH